jgi:hypothetical protein
VRQFHEDRDLTAWFLLDLSGSVDFGSGDVSKLAVSAGFVAALARVVTRHGNRVGALFYGGGGGATRRRPARPGRRARAATAGAHARGRSRRPPRRRAAPRCTTCCAAPKACCSGARWSSWCPTSSAPRLGGRAGRLARRHDVVAVRLFDPPRWPCPTSAWSRWRTPRPASSSSSTPPTRPSARATPPGRGSGGELPTRWRAPASTLLELATDDDLLDALLRFADLRRRRAFGGRLPAHLAGAVIQGEAA